jgi:hypothetical protein
LLQAILQVRKANKEDKLRQELLTLTPGARIKIRGHSGVFEVSLVRVDDQKRDVEVIWDHGILRTFKWGNVILGDSDASTMMGDIAIPGISAAETQPSYNILETSAVSSSGPPANTILPSLSSLAPELAFTSLY